MNFVINSSHAPVGARPIHHWGLATLLKAFGVAPIQNRLGHRAVLARRNLWDLWDVVKAHWKILRKKLHPDVSYRHHGEFAAMSRIFDTIKLRFKAKGIA